MSKNNFGPVVISKPTTGKQDRWSETDRAVPCRLAAVNFFLFLANGTQVVRYLIWSRSQSSTTVKEDIKSAARDGKQEVKGAAKDVKSAVEHAAK